MLWPAIRLDRTRGGRSSYEGSLQQHAAAAAANITFDSDQRHVVSQSVSAATQSSSQTHRRHVVSRTPGKTLLHVSASFYWFASVLLLGNLECTRCRQLQLVIRSRGVLVCHMAELRENG